MTIADSLHQVKLQIANACDQAKRPHDSVRLLAVSKTKPIRAIEQAYAAGQRDFGENYVQEGVDKIVQLKALQDITWHFIGPLQSNKTRLVAEHFDWLQSLERDKIARRLNEQRSPHQAPLQVLIQVNLDNEHSKAGIPLGEVLPFAEQLQSYSRLQLRGLMAIPKAQASTNEQSQRYRALAQAFSQLQDHYPQIDTLSLGMSGDLDAAIAHGSTMVRIGTSIFGSRQA